jgi:hypothetical protein
VQGAAIYEVDPDQARPATVDGQVPQRHGDAVSVDGHAIGGRRRDSSKCSPAVEGDRLGDCDESEAAGIKAIDDASIGRFRDGSTKGLAGRRAAAVVGVIAYA